MCPAATVTLLPARRLTSPLCAWSEPVPPRAMFLVPAFTTSAPAVKSRPACKVTDQFSPATMLGAAGEDRPAIAQKSPFLTF
jgi:hypothetical protein